MPIALICGKSDLLAAPRDYNAIKVMLEDQNSLSDFHETEHGHLGLLSPAIDQTAHLDYLIDKLLKEKVMDTYGEE